MILLEETIDGEIISIKKAKNGVITLKIKTRSKSNGKFLNFLQENWVEILSTAGTIALILAKTKGTVDPKTAQERKYKKSVNKELKLLKRLKKFTKKGSKKMLTVLKQNLKTTITPVETLKKQYAKKIL